MSEADAEVRLTPFAAFVGPRGVPLIAFGHNSIFPGLVIGPGAVTIRVLWRHRLAYRDLARIGPGRGGRHRLAFEPKRGVLTYTVDLGGDGQFMRAVAALADRKAPLDPRLAALLIGRSAGGQATGEAPRTGGWPQVTGNP